MVGERGIVPKIAHSTVSLVLKTADLQPHRSRYWKTPILNEEFVRRASRILWCYENVDKLYDMGAVIICLDEKPNLQALERRCPTKLVTPGMIERREFEYIRHGTVNFVAALIVHDGQMRGWCLDKNDSEHLRPVLVELLDEFKDARRVYLIWDGGPSHRSMKTKEFLKGYGNLVRVLMTPAHASWLDQAERAHSHNLGGTKLLYNLLPGVILKGISIQSWITTGGDYVCRDITAIGRRNQGKRS